MKYYFAPLEGVTGYVYRNAYETFFGQIDKYFMPFISPTKNKSFTSRELNDVLPEHNEGINVIPQILTNNSEYFIDTVNQLGKFGNNEVNLNLGCPSGTVVAKHKGSGFLAQRKQLDEFLEDIFSNASTKISIKTRIGKDSPDEFYELIEIFNKYPLEELIIHPRIQTDFYKNKPNMEVFKDALALSKNPVCYNGDIFNIEDYKKLSEAYPKLETVMLGRGLIANPGLIEEIKTNRVMDKELMKSFHDKVCTGYEEVLSGDRNVLFKMKELWFYMIHMFSNSDKYAKKIRKTNSLQEYKGIISSMFQELDIKKTDIHGF
ncbi:tRNA dihydrouridine synthase [Clostridium beijerinckii]|jgi:tRNA-U20a,U20b-dihydrouridine synthase|uniref:tRNA-dihydrouridine synthase n=2 Tax=Clostridium beijerinckii TaxID=1520 RepID=A0AAE2RWH6_CLOBE|nr:tRNA-dihydrouridine synthase family protein [Clostridium beijerinckii]ABR34252.1 dihydrouridine synthase, DuS [Clostridium beijerinckii NCIMB 8052]AIU02139.1 dihydrouridine synthase, DuS [Clostridium beijerinckii ATCC 35702]MBF7811139.1 tRNA-dihydrouridine synthase family protein [Clostridium beijerinckii]NOW91878.1 tRNA-dihydrouridine synthase [Clostridium beijerinckii]NRT24440.1 tRNA-dihydrouridine synthase [Clostridium beijerinckii]